MASVISGDANVSATEFGYLDGVTSALQTQMDAKLATATAASTYLPLAGGKILQIVRATDSTDRTTTSTSFVDANISVTITPTKNTSAILLVWTFNGIAYAAGSTSTSAQFAITDNSNNIITGPTRLNINGASGTLQINTHITLFAYATPATTSATTYKGRFLMAAGSTAAEIYNSTFLPGQLYAIEVSA